MRERSTTRRSFERSGHGSSFDRPRHYTRRRRPFNAPGLPAHRIDSASPPTRAGRSLRCRLRILGARHMRHGSPLSSPFSPSPAAASCPIDLTPRVRPLEESTVEGTRPGQGAAGGPLRRPGRGADLHPRDAGRRSPLLARVREELEKAEEDDRVRALVLRINSPGGTVTASDILYHEITRFKERRKVPVVASILDVGASGGYYVALAADRIVVHPTTVTGLHRRPHADGQLQRAPREDRGQRRATSRPASSRTWAAPSGASAPRSGRSSRA